MSDTDNAYNLAARSVLEDVGFKVYLNSYVEGLSGLRHSFDIVALKLNRLVCISIKPPTPIAILTEMAKSMDVRGVVIVAVLGDAPQGVSTEFNGKRFKMLPVKSPEELASRLNKLLAETEALIATI